ncbi:MAG: helix-turn-helix domain-containing protein [Planctomycetota bacterium]
MTTTATEHSTRSADLPALLSRDETAALVGISTPTLDRLNRRGKTPRTLTLGGRRLYRRADVDRWIELGCPDRREFDARTSGTDRAADPKRPNGRRPAREG